ncbi:TolB family protein [Pontimicrobium aquaticum]|nr:PD40 domain-containing protein [Pontimicrobium aquaticum]
METKLLLKGSINRRGEYGAITSPDNLKIIFNTYRFSGWKLGIGDFDGKNISNIKKLTNRKNYEYCAQYSPDGSKIAYVEYDWSVRESDIYIADKNGKNGKYFFKTGISDQNIDWTRDSESIVFTLKKNKSLSIYIKSLNGGKAKKIVSHLANDFAPSTSKLEDKIAFLSDKEGKIHLFVVNTDGSNLKNLTPTLESSDGDENGIWPYKTSWSPDGKKIVFNVIINGDLEIFIVNSDGTELTQITNNNDTDMTPYWLN